MSACVRAWGGVAAGGAIRLLGAFAPCHLDRFQKLMLDSIRIEMGEYVSTAFAKDLA